MEFPEDVLGLIREFSQPMTRADWRVCKKKEAACIQKTERNTIRFFEDLYQARPELHVLAPNQYYTIPHWPLYCRIRLIKTLIRI
jgi:hypothetical protein